jgi:predicted alpha/beta hydrolase
MRKQGSMSDIEPRELTLPATDGFRLAATLYRSAELPANAPAVLINPATGVKRRYYDRYARYLADSGFVTLTFDYRGIGGSRPRSLRGFSASMTDWAEKDSAGAIAWLSAEHQPRRLLLVGHSLGGQLLGLIPSNQRVDAMLAIAAQSGYWGFWRGSRKYFMWMVWHVLMPGMTRLFSYFPARRLGLSEDLPAGVARQWAYWGRNPNYIVDDAGQPIREHFAAYNGPIRSYSFSDDIHAPRAAVEALIGCYTQAPKELNHRTPRDLKVDKIGHFGFFREEFRDSLWSETTAWLKQQAGAASRAASS